MNKINAEVKKILKDRHDKAVRVAEENLAIARNNKKFKDIEKKQAELCFEIANLIADNKDTTSLKQELETLSDEKEIVLKKMGLKEKDLIPNFKCKKCLDTGKNNCSCAKKIKTLLLLKNSNINDGLEDFKDAKITSRNFELALNKLKEWSEKVPNVKYQNLFISGQTGTGKTFLSKCLMKSLLDKEFFVYYITAFSLNQLFLSFIKDELALEDVLDSDFLIIDDLGTEPLLNNITLNYLYLVLNERIVRNKFTLINSNLGPEEILNRYGERIFSRIFNKKNGIAIKLEGEDLRLKK